MADLFAPPIVARRRRSTPLEDIVCVATNFWLVVGLFLDGWAHENKPQLETFYTPWHGVFYTGFAATVLWLAVMVYRRMSPMLPRIVDAVPIGYGWGLVGVVVFAAGGVGDLIWHSIFGIESGLDALFSPSHLLLLSGMVLLITSPVRAARDRQSTSGNGPALVAIALAAAVVAFFFQYISLFRSYEPALSEDQDLSFWDQAGLGGPVRDMIFGRQVRGFVSVLVTTLILIAPLLYLLRQRLAPPGAATMIFGITGAAMCSISSYDAWELGVVGVAAGVVTDLVIVLLRRMPQRTWTLHVVAVAGPVVLIGFYLAAVWWRVGIGWSIELWSGTIIFGMLGGLALSVLTGSGEALALDRARLAVRGSHADPGNDVAEGGASSDGPAGIPACGGRAVFADEAVAGWSGD